MPAELGQSGSTVVSTAVTIASGATESDAIDLSYYQLFAIEMPAAFTGASLSFKASRTVDGTYQAVHDDTGTQVSVTVAASRTVVLPNVALSVAPLRFIKLVSSAAEGAARTLYLIGKR